MLLLYPTHDSSRKEANWLRLPATPPGRYTNTVGPSPDRPPSTRPLPSSRYAAMIPRPLLTSAVLLAFSLPLLADDWPQWRGPDRTDISRETGVLKTWPA